MQANAHCLLWSFLARYADFVSAAYPSFFPELNSAVLPCTVGAVASFAHSTEKLRVVDFYAGKELHTTQSFFSFLSSPVATLESQFTKDV